MKENHSHFEQTIACFLYLLILLCANVRAIGQKEQRIYLLRQPKGKRKVATTKKRARYYLWFIRIT